MALQRPQVEARPQGVIIEATVVRERVSSRRRAVSLYLTCALLVALVSVVLSMDAGRAHPHPPSAPRLAHLRGAAGVAAAYGYPLRCLSVAILTSYPTYARADFNHRSPCGRYSGYATAVFHYVAHAWRPALDALSYRCPVRTLPVAVQTQLDVCLRASG
jgi:hypothetical protein